MSHVTSTGSLSREAQLTSALLCWNRAAGARLLTAGMLLHDAHPCVCTVVVPCRDLEGATPAGQASDLDSRVVSAKLAVSPGGLVSVKSTVIPRVSEEPFWVTPSSALVSGGQSQQFVVHFAASSAQQHDGYLLGTQRVDRTQEGQVSLPPANQLAALRWS